MDRIFTYGTLRPSLYPDRTPPGAGPAVRARLVDHLVMVNLGRFPALVESPDEHEIVGETFEIDTIERFDRYEGYLPNGKGLYDRKIVKVRAEDGRVYEVWIYFMHADRFAEDGGIWGNMVPSGDWADVKGETCPTKLR